MTKRIYLSPPDMTSAERGALLRAFDSNWIAPLGPEVDAFEEELAARAGRQSAAALSSGTAGLHLALVLLGVERGDEVWTSTMTFAATANAIRYVGATPVFVDSERDSWNMDPELLAEALAERAATGALPKAVIVVDLYGQCADYGRILRTCDEYEVPVIEDAAEALGAKYRDAPAGSFGALSVFSFNGNKIITTSGGGALLGNDEALIQRARHLGSQAREPVPHFEHVEIGYNYRLSNLLAALGRAQLARLDGFVERTRGIHAEYRRALGDIDGIEFLTEADGRYATHWLTCLLLDGNRVGADPDAVCNHLGSLGIEARPVWKPMHLQPVFADCKVVGGAVAEELFARGVCLPSGSSLSSQDQRRVIEAFLDTPGLRVGA